MAAVDPLGEPDLTIGQIDAMIDAAVDARVLIVAHWTWFAVQSVGRDLKTRNNGGLNYRGLDVWISDRTRIGTAAEDALLRNL
ncbi:hypothetical protein [uncultured Brevundimonas sp.]|uniref:hypothetical protein n=1 Tax=uncultured Brevundimonas sp. TaxID=213418 RepID=UPI0025E4DA93|nr:hypothetical protein [uncultured Brevundimonas sp.]